MPETGVADLKRITINDVADHAGVSIKTVSRVLNHEPRVRSATRERVEQAMKALKYRPNSPARMLAGKRTYLLGLVYNANSSYITRIQNGVLKICRSEHYDLLIHPCSYTDPALLSEIRELVEGGRVDGLILVPPVSDLPAVMDLIRALGVPTVTLSREAAAPSEWTVGTNDQQASTEMVLHLSDLGHEHIAFVCGHPDHKVMARRHRGFLAGMAESGLAVVDSLVTQGENTLESGVRCAQQLLQNKPRPTAIFCANDHMAAGVMKVAHEMGLRVPDDLSVAGFDDLPLASQIWPQLTTVRQPLDEMARNAAALLIGGLRGSGTEELRRVVDATLVVRQSTGPAPLGAGF